MSDLESAIETCGNFKDHGALVADGNDERFELVQALADHQPLVAAGGILVHRSVHRGADLFVQMLQAVGFRVK